VPAFFVDAGSTGIYDQRLRVVSLATGTVTATENAPAGTGDITFLAEQRHTGNYVAAFTGSSQPASPELILYRFSITGTGKITPLTRINGIGLKQQPGNLTVLALSPDGSRLALSWTPDNVPDGVAVISKIIVLNLRTGARQEWKDNLANGAHHPLITSAVWTSSGGALVFASRVCKLNTAAGPCFWEFRSLQTPPAGGELHAGPVLLRLNGRGGENQAPAISPDGGSVVEVRNGVPTGRSATVVRIGLATGSRLVRHRATRSPGPELSRSAAPQPLSATSAAANPRNP
jgi:Tol biopolymer transport system component